MASNVDRSETQLSAEKQSDATIPDIDSVNEENETQNDEFDDSAPNWAFASFVAESDELLSLFANLKPVQHSQRIIDIVRYLSQ